MGAWKPDKEDELARRWNAGETAADIAGALGPRFNRNMVIGKAHRLGLPSRPSPIRRVA